MTVKYEDLTTDPEQTMRGVLKFLGLDYQQACVEPESAYSIITSPSQVPLRNPISTDFTGHWQKYATLLEPLMTALAEGRSFVKKLHEPEQEHVHAGEAADVEDN